ncbi:MAG TPA: hypothetical protein VHV26_14545 [Rhizomicrobium sp.]|jgi:hypothetical protein|nr:hypothetical protein [Rhizomicrobium sp.]
MLGAFPTILVAVVLYSIVALVGGLSHHDIQSWLSDAFQLKMFSGDLWRISVGDLFVLAALAMLFIEVVKATRTSQREILNHAFSMLTFVVALVEFITLHGFATSVFFLIMVMTLFDVVAGYTISIVTARRDLSVVPPASTHG